MGVSKTSLFTPKQNELAALAKAFAHPARIAILEYLLKTQVCITGTLVDEIGLAQATISQHLKVLKEEGLIQGSIEGTSVCYCINPDRWKAAMQIMNELFDRFPTNDCC
jgi:DNA-binding transcriptional ArsR family regulator